MGHEQCLPARCTCTASEDSICCTSAKLANRSTPFAGTWVGWPVLVHNCSEVGRRTAADATLGAQQCTASDHQTRDDERYVSCVRSAARDSLRVPATTWAEPETLRRCSERPRIRRPFATLHPLSFHQRLRHEQFSLQPSSGRLHRTYCVDANLGSSECLLHHQC